jgi:flagellar hook-associated protein 2
MPGFSIDGISSGIDTTAYVDALMELERRPAALLEVQQAEKTNIVSTLKALTAKVLALKSHALQLQRKSNFNKANVTISDEDVISATAGGRVGAGSYDLQILSLARNHQIASQGFTDESISSFGTGTITLGVGSTSPKTVTIDSSNNSLVGIKKAINDAKAGVTATIVNDGSDSNSYRLVITADRTGLGNSINITSSLTGGNNLNYSTAIFDDPETLVMDSSSDSSISLGASASYTGDTNKIYTFTVAGTGSQTVGDDPITIDWTDGTDSGQIIVSQADAEVVLAGAGSDGLKLSFSAGTLKEGDKFQVQTFASLLQDASDATIAIGSAGGAGSPITVTSDTNSFNDVIAGVSLELKKETSAGEHVTISTDVDIAGIKALINDFISAYNDVNGFIDKQNSYNVDTKESGVLLGDYVIQTMQGSIRRMLASRVDGLDSKYNQLYSVGIRTGVDGKLSIKDSSRLEEALRENLDEVINLFADSGSSSSTSIEFVSAGTSSKLGEGYAVDITQVATQGYFRGGGIDDPASSPLVLDSSNNRLKFSINGVESDELILTAKTYNSSAELVSEIQDKIDNDQKIGSRGLTVEWIDSGAGNGFLELTSSTYGSASKVGIVTSIPSSAFAIIGLATGAGSEGVNVEGTINGEAANGVGQFLTGKEGNDTTDGLKLEVTLTSDQLGDGSEGTITLSRGVASNLNSLLQSITMTGDGLLDRRIKSYQGQVDNLQSRIAAFDERLVFRRQRLLLQFQRMEEVLGQLNAQGDYLAGQLTQINANWKA